MLIESTPHLTWEVLKNEFLQRLGHFDANPYQVLASIQQIGTVAEYVEDFEMVAALVPRQPELQYVGYFMSGLKDEVRSKHSTTRISAMRLARLAEATLTQGENKGGNFSQVRSWGLCEQRSSGSKVGS